MRIIRFLVLMVSVCLLLIGLWLRPAAALSAVQSPSSIGLAVNLPPFDSPLGTPEPPVGVQWGTLPEKIELAAGGQIQTPLTFKIDQATTSELTLTAVSDRPEFQVSVTPDAIAFEPDTALNVVLTVQTQAGLPVGVASEITVSVADKSGELAQITLPAIITWPDVVTLAIDPADLTVAPQGEVATDVVIANHDGAVHALTIRLLNDDSAPFDYSTTLQRTTWVLEPGASQAFELGFTPWPSALAGAQGLTAISVRVNDPSNERARGDAITAKARAVVEEQSALEVRLSPGQASPEWDKVAEYTLFITNTGSVSALPQIEVSNGPDHFTAQIDQIERALPLKPGDGVQLALTVKPVFAGLADFMASASPRLHALTPDDLEQFKGFLREGDTTTVRVTLGNASGEAQVWTQRPARPRTDDLSAAGRDNSDSTATPSRVGPHTSNSLTCGVCHEPHGSPMADQPGKPSQLLLASTVRGLCDTCHDGTGSIYNVEDGTVSGVFASNAGPIKPPQEAPDAVSGYFFVPQVNLVLKTIIDYLPLNPTQVQITAAGRPAASAHPIEVQHQAAGGSGQADWLTCTACHDPHGNSQNARFFPEKVTFGGQTVTVNFSAQYGPAPREAANLLSGSVDACQACHAQIDNHGDSGPRYLDNDPAMGKPWATFQARLANQLPLEADGQTTNRHMVCLTCHAAHGTRANIPGYFEKLVRPPLADIQDKYGFWCLACHDL